MKNLQKQTHTKVIYEDFAGCFKKVVTVIEDYENNIIYLKEFKYVLSSYRQNDEIYVANFNDIKYNFDEKCFIITQKDEGYSMLNKIFHNKRVINLLGMNYNKIEADDFRIEININEYKYRKEEYEKYVKVKFKTLVI